MSVPLVSSKICQARHAGKYAATRLRTNSLFRQLLPEPQAPAVKPLKGGGFNYIKAVMLPPWYTDEGQRELILRIPREEYLEPEFQVVTLTIFKKAPQSRCRQLQLQTLRATLR